MKDLLHLQPGVWVRSIYGGIGILQDPPVIDGRVNAVRAYDSTIPLLGTPISKGSPMQTLVPFVTVVPEGTPQDADADFPTG